MVAETERKFIRERQQAGIETAKAKGIYILSIGADCPQPSPTLERPGW
jgi:DNA invertase Pin-like site-specific DNA recombinase